MRIQVEKTKDYKWILQNCYFTDEYFIEKFHSKRGEIDNSGAIDRELEAMLQMANSGRYTAFCLFVKEEFVGYFGIHTEHNIECLAGFFILPHFRTKEFKGKFWRIIKSKFKSDLYCTLYTNNTRAIAFIKKVGFKPFGEIVISNDCPVQSFCFRNKK